MASRLLLLLLNQLMRLKQLLLLLRLVDNSRRRTTRLAPSSSPSLLLLLQRDVVRTDEGRVELVARDGRDAVRGGPGRRLRRTRPVHHRAGIRAAAVAAAADKLLLLGLLTERLPPVADAPGRFAVLVLSHGDSAVRYQQDILRLLMLLLVMLLLMVLLELLMVLLLLER